MFQNSKDTIVAIATASGKGGVGVVRLSGEDLEDYIHGILGKTIKPRQGTYSQFLDSTGDTIDEGIALYFPAPTPLLERPCLSFRVMEAWSFLML